VSDILDDIASAVADRNTAQAVSEVKINQLEGALNTSRLENDELSTENEALKTEVDELSTQLQTLQQQLDDCMAGQPKPPSLTLGNVVFTPEDISKWTTASPEYTRLLNSWAGRVTRDDPVPTSFPSHTSAESESMRQAAIFVKTQSMLFLANKEPTRKARAFDKLDQFSLCTTWVGGGDANLSAAWIATVVAQGAYLSGYPVDKLKGFFDMIEPRLDHPLGGNWHATFVDARLAISSLRKDTTKFLDNIDYLDFHIPQTLHHPQYDGDKIKPITSPGLWPGCKTETNVSASMTEQHWWKQVIRPDFKAVYKGVPFVKGVGAERIRDPGHEMMGLYSWINACRTIKACGGVVPKHVHDRIVAHADVLGSSVLQYLQTGKFAEPVPLGKDLIPGTADDTEGGGYLMGWFGVNKYLGAESPQSVKTLLTRAEVKTAAAAGYLHVCDDPYANEK